jgi:equilibrative nucleoside transporter 1/2/3
MVSVAEKQIFDLSLIHNLRNMFLAAFPYFQYRFSSSPWLLAHFPSAIISVSTVTNLVSVGVLTHLQAGASYPSRITASLILNIITFTLLALSTVLFRHVSAATYFGFLMANVFAASLATGLCQNGIFAYVSGFGNGSYTQAIMTGQGIAGVLPCIVQIVSVLSVPEANEGADHESPKSAFAYFLTATAVSALALAAFLLVLVRKHGERAGETKATTDAIDGAEAEDHPEGKVVGMWTLFRKLRWMAMAVFLCFTVTMLFPVFTQEIYSVRPADTTPRLFRPACFIPLAFLFWNAGDLVGRLLTAKFAGVRHPRALFILSVARFGFIPLYLLCNIHGRGAAFSSDFFYLVVVQFLFGISNGYLGSSCMMGASGWVDASEREAAGSFMGLMLVGGLTAGSLLSFLVL